MTVTHLKRGDAGGAVIRAPQVIEDANDHGPDLGRTASSATPGRVGTCRAASRPCRNRATPHSPPSPGLPPARSCPAGSRATGTWWRSPHMSPAGSSAKPPSSTTAPASRTSFCPAVRFPARPPPPPTTRCSWWCASTGPSPSTVRAPRSRRATPWPCGRSLARAPDLEVGRDEPLPGARHRRSARADPPRL